MPSQMKMFYDDDNEEQTADTIEVSAMWTRMDTTISRTSKGLSELQTDAMGSTEQMEGEGWIYFIETENGQYVKIGFSFRPVRRLGQLGTLMPVRLVGCFPGSKSTERWLHARFAPNRRIGEWFSSTPELRLFIVTVGMVKPKQPTLPRIKENRPDSEKNEAAVALAKLRMKRMTADERSEVARKAGIASKAALTPEQRSEIARKGGLAGGRGRKKDQE